MGMLSPHDLDLRVAWHREDFCAKQNPNGLPARCRAVRSQSQVRQRVASCCTRSPTGSAPPFGRARVPIRRLEPQVHSMSPR